MKRKDRAAHEGAIYAQGRVVGLRQACAILGIDARLMTETMMRQELAALARKITTPPQDADA